MRVAILHFHLRAGGVTRVIEMARQSLLESRDEVLVISGEPAPWSCRLPSIDVTVAPSLAYDVSALSADQLCEEVDAAMHRRWGAPADVLHIHNHCLGKNFALPLAVARWAEEGRHLLLQIHDFAENGRPLNYHRLLAELGGSSGLDRCLYPVAPQIAYAFLNSTDQTRLLACGLTGLNELLPNPVVLPQGNHPVAPSELSAERLLVYPTRAIRRKNIGEALLWATQVAPGDKIVLTAAPVTPVDLALMKEWRAFAESLRLPVVFEAQAQLSRPTVDFLRGSHFCLTTSVTEGFGMAFLEPWLAGSSLTGRDLPGVTRDFRSAGVRLDGLYQRIDIPEALAGDIDVMVRTILRRLGDGYGFDVTDEQVRRAVGSVRRGPTVDFGRLDEACQRDFIRTVASGRLSLPFELEAPSAPNEAVITDAYSLPAYRGRLESLYSRLVAQSAQPPLFLNSTQVLREHLSFDDFFALRS